MIKEDLMGIISSINWKAVTLAAIGAAISTTIGWLQSVPVDAVVALALIVSLAAYSLFAAIFKKLHEFWLLLLSALVLGASVYWLVDGNLFFEKNIREMAQLLESHGTNVDYKARRVGVKKSAASQTFLKGGYEVIYFSYKPFLYVIKAGDDKNGGSAKYQTIYAPEVVVDRKYFQNDGLFGGLSKYRSNIESIIGGKAIKEWTCSTINDDFLSLESGDTVIAGPAMAYNAERRTDNLMFWILLKNSDSKSKEWDMFRADTYKVEWDCKK